MHGRGQLEDTSKRADSPGKESKEEQPGNLPDVFSARLINGMINFDPRVLCALQLHSASPASAMRLMHFTFTYAFVPVVCVLVCECFFSFANVALHSECITVEKTTSVLGRLSRPSHRRLEGNLHAHSDTYSDTHNGSRLSTGCTFPQTNTTVRGICCVSKCMLANFYPFRKIA